MPTPISPFTPTVLVGVLFASSASASVVIDWVTVGNSGNAADSSGYGAVSQTYKIGKYEVTNGQYAEFLNAKGSANGYGIYNSGMAGLGIAQSGSSGSFSYSVTGALANRPVAYVSWFDAARFANWLLNGQGSGTTETGAYTLNGAMSGNILANAGAGIHLPSEDEWYKAAYYNGNTSSYSLYPNGQNTITTADANYFMSVGSATNVGAYPGDASYYGTFDQGGNVHEWNDAVMYGSLRGLRGGSWANYGDSYLASSSRGGYTPDNEFNTAGFRLAAVPEPTAMILSSLAGFACLIRRKR